MKRVLNNMQQCIDPQYFLYKVAIQSQDEGHFYAVLSISQHMEENMEKYCMSKEGESNESME